MHPNTSPRQTLPASNIFRGRRAGRFDVDLARRITSKPLIVAQAVFSVIMGIPAGTGRMNTPGPRFRVHSGWFPS